MNYKHYSFRSTVSLTAGLSDPRHLKKILEKLHLKQTEGTDKTASTISPVETTLTLDRSSFLYSAVKLYNQLPEVIREESRI